MNRFRTFLAVLLSSALVVAPAVAQFSAAAKKSYALQFKEYKLKNGLRVILSEDHSAPTYSICVTYDVGSRDERVGRTGFAHLFEHMMFQGSENVGKGEHFILVLNNGGGMNGTTNPDRTNYFQTLPANQLDLGLYLEADRMRSLDLSQENLDNQRNAVQEERRLGIDNQPYGKTFEAILDTAYDNFAYKHSTIGSMEDLNAANLDDVREFFRQYYSPSNAVLTMVGNFKSEEALAKIKKYFEGLPSSSRPAPPDMTEPPQNAERRKTLEDAFARTPRLDIVFKVPPGNTPDWYALDVTGDVLLRGQSSRLFQKLVREKQVALNVFGGVQDRRGPSMFSIIVLPRPGVDPAEVEKLVYEELATLQAESVTATEMEKIKAMNRRFQYQQLQGSLFRAIQLGWFAVAYGDAGLINSRFEKLDKVTAADVQRVAQKFLTESNRTVITTVPKPRAAD